LKASYNWLKEFVDFTINPEDLAHALTMSGLEVEGVIKSGDDTVFDINVTPNRPDCLSIIGIAREISAILQVPFKHIHPEIKEQEGRGPEVEIRNPQLCRRYAARSIRGVKPAPSPKWLIDRLESHGFRTSYNIVDITNYVLMETGQPLHAFDLDKIAGERISVRTAEHEKKFLTLDGESRQLSKDMLLIWDEEQPVALAGIMGGMNTEVSSGTVNVLLESAYFNPSSVRRTSKSLNISTESSYRFERGVDIGNITDALNRAAQMIVEIAGGSASALTDCYPNPPAPAEVTLEHEKINSIIGVEIDQAFTQKILNTLGLKTRKNGGGFIVTPPSFRQDIQRDVDLAEEVARLYGYEKIPATFPNMTMRPATENRQQKLIKTIRNSMSKAGFSEVINYSFFNADVLDALNLPHDDKRRKTILIRNPLRKDESSMRTTLLPALIKNLSLNLNRGEKMLRFFEVSKVFFDSGEKLPIEVSQMAAIFHKDKSSSLWMGKHDGFYDLKGAFEILLHDLKIGNCRFVQDPTLLEPYHHPMQSCSLMVRDEIIGSLGVLHPAVSESFEITDDISILEIYDIMKLLENSSGSIQFVSLPKFPYVERDLAIIVSFDVTHERIRKEIFNINSSLIESVQLFDIYRGKPIPKDKKSLAFSIRYRAGDRTLTDEEVDSLHTSIVDRLKNLLNAELRS